jgi:RNA polymerase sigma-54 factor
MWQLNCSAYSEDEKRLGFIIIGNINDEGYLESDIESLAQEAGVSVDSMEDTLILVQSLDPPGVAARNLKECLLLQMRANHLRGTLVEKLITNHLESLDERNFPRIAKAEGVEVEAVIDAVRAIREFDPKPGLQFNPEETRYITPDLFIVKIDDNYQVYLNDEGIPRLRINPYYHSILKNKEEDNKNTREYVENKFRSALWLIKSIEQRRQTMLKVGRSIIKFQREFLDKGINYLKPLILKDVAEDIGMHESTISRVTTNKYIHTPQGLLELKYFFHSSVGSYLGNDMSSVRVKEMIRKLVKEEDSSKPLTDDQIVKLLQGKDVKIARRTVTKYRKELKISSTSKRKKLLY